MFGLDFLSAEFDHPFGGLFQRRVAFAEGEPDVIFGKMFMVRAEERRRRDGRHANMLNQMLAEFDVIAGVNPRKITHDKISPFGLDSRHAAGLDHLHDQLALAGVKALDILHSSCFPA